MKTTLLHLVLAGLACAIALAGPAFAQRQLGRKLAPVSKLYLAEAQGEGQIVAAGRAYAPQQASAFDAPGTVIETGGDAHQVYVYSNGTVMYVDKNTRVEVERFLQEPFTDTQGSSEVEPSVSQSDVFVARGKVGLHTGELVSGTTMTYTTSLARVAIRGGKLFITAHEDYTIVSLLEGDVTVHTVDHDTGGTLLHPGEQIVIRRGPPGQPPTILVSAIDGGEKDFLVNAMTVAQNARRTVSFEVVNKTTVDTAALAQSAAGAEAPTQEIAARPTVTASPPTNLTVSPDRLPPQPGG